MEVVTGIVADPALKFGCVTSVQVLIRIIGNSCMNASYYISSYNKYMCVCVRALREVTGSASTSSQMLLLRDEDCACVVHVQHMHSEA